MNTEALGEHPYLDGDTRRGLDVYAENDREILEPTQLRALGAVGLGEVAVQCRDMLTETYQGKYPMDVKNDEVLARQINEGSMHLFTLQNKTENAMEAMAGIEEQPNKLGGDIHFAELGKALERPESTSSSRALLKARVPWAMQNLPQLDFLYSTTRTGAEHDGIASGKGVQSIWWGGQRFPGMVPIQTTQCGWEYKLGGVEPFNGFVIPTDREKWLEAAADKPMFVSNEQDRERLQTLLSEATDGKLGKHILVSDAPEPDEIEFATLQKESVAAGGKYAITNQPHELKVKDEYEIEESLSNSFSQKVKIEADVAGSEAGTGVAEKLRKQGWSLAGWEPSALEYGALCPVFARVNPDSLSELVEPEHHAKYFDEAGLAGTRHALDTMYMEMKAKAAAKAAYNVNTEPLQQLA